MSESPHSVRVVVLIDDMIFATKIASTGSAVGICVATVKTAEAVTRAMAESRVSLLIVDLGSTGDEAFAAIDAAVAHASRPRVVAFVSHVDIDMANRARSAGADEVLARSKFSQALPQLLTDGAVPPTRRPGSV